MSRDKKGIALVMLIFLLVACALVATVAFSLLVQGTTTGLGLSESMQAYAIAIGGKEWYLQRLAEEEDWTDEDEQPQQRLLGAGGFNIVIDDATANSVSFTVTGEVTGYFDQKVLRQIRLTAKKLPKACRFAVFWQDAPADTLTLKKVGGDTTNIYGNFWSVGSMVVEHRCSVEDGRIYYGAGATVSGQGTYKTQEVQRPFPDMPTINTEYYEKKMEEYDKDIDQNDSQENDFYPYDTLELKEDDPYLVQDFKTHNDLKIIGSGKIVANRDVLLHYTGQSGTLSIIPDPGRTIEILAGHDFKINNRSSGKRKVDINPETVLYARNQGSNTSFQIFERTKKFATSIARSLILARRQLTVENGAEISEKSILYLDGTALDANNLLQIKDKAIVEGAVISRGLAYPSLLINAGASVTGLVYQYGSSAEGPGPVGGQTQVDGNSKITGALLVRKFKDSRLGPATIAYDLDAVLNAIPEKEGFNFNGYVMSAPDSWDDHEPEPDP